MKTPWSVVALFTSVLALSLSAFGQNSQTAPRSLPETPPPQSTNSQTSEDDCARKDNKWDLIYPASQASYVGGTVPEMDMGEGNRLVRWIFLQERQFRRKGKIALAPGCLLFAFDKQEGDSFFEFKARQKNESNVYYDILGCHDKVKLSNSEGFCVPALNDQDSGSYVRAIPYAKVNGLSRAKYATADLASVSTAYVGFGAAILTAIYNSIHNTSVKEKALAGAAGFFTLYYCFAVAQPRMGDNYIAVFVEPPVSQISLSRESNQVTVTTLKPHYFHAGQQIEVSDVANSHLADIGTIKRNEAGTVTVTTVAPHGLKGGELVQIADVPDPSFNGQFQVLPPVGSTTFTYEPKDKPKAPESHGGEVQEVWNGTFVVRSVDSADRNRFTYWQVGPNDWTSSKEKKTAPGEGPNPPAELVPGTVGLAAPKTTNLEVRGTLDLNQPKPADLTGTATLQPPPAKSDELFQKGDLLMFRIPNKHDYYNISMTLSGNTGLTFVSEAAEKPAK